uniref:DUF2264 domain-containing protein n=1 Tax=Marinobacterium profundum TaxID=1714300 RepID=UPI00082B2FC1|nr:DUF2264 domain-containing protein [Marinobacterium profundum]
MINGQDLALIFRMQKQRWHRRVNRRPNFDQQDETLVSEFQNHASVPMDRLEQLLRYFWNAHQHYLHVSGTLAYYPGEGSIYGARSDAIEGVTRLLPLWSAYRSSPYADPQLRQAMDQQVVCALSNGTDPMHPGYWGEINSRSTLICEAGDIALALWMIRDSLWTTFDHNQQHKILAWLRQVVGKQTVDNNWHLFVVLVDKVCESLDTGHSFRSADRYRRIKSFYRGNGCFADGEHGAIDLYNAWAFQYSLYWLDQIDPDFDRTFIHQAGDDFCAWYQYLFTDQGVVLFGRSLCYRMAAPSPLLIASEWHPQRYPAAMAQTALDSCWRFFIENGGVRLGRPTQGVFDDDPVWLDPYSGPASSFWATRSLVIYYHQTGITDWRKLAPAPLPSQQQTTRLRVEAAGLELTTQPENRRCTVTFYNQPEGLIDAPPQQQSAREWLRQSLYGVACRPSNNLLKQGVREFDSSLSIYRRR